ISRSREVNDFRGFHFLRRFQAHMQQHGSVTKLAFERKLGRVVFCRRTDANVLGVELFQKPGNIEMESAPAGFAIVLATEDFLHGGVDPDLPAIALVRWCAATQADLQSQGLPLPAFAYGSYQLLQPAACHVPHPCDGPGWRSVRVIIPSCLKPDD